MDKMTRQITRRMAWERAKGELLSILEVYFGEQEQFVMMEKKISNFIEDVESNW